MNDVVRVGQITAAWLSELLDARVDSVDVARIGTGQVGETYRLTLTGAGAPATLIGKFAATDPTSRAAATAQGSYVREVGFYRDLAPHADLPVPHALHAAIDPATQDFALIMQDCPTHRPGNQLQPISPGEAECAVDALAAIHAAWWDDPILDKLSYLPGAVGAAKPALDPLYAMLWPGFLQRYGDRVSPAMREVGDSYSGRVDEWAAPRNAPRCLVHGDYRIDNMLLGADPPVIVVDWQTVAVGCGATDLAYFAGTSLTPKARRDGEARLFDRWHARVGGDRERLWHVYRRDAFAGFIMSMAASMIVGRTDRGDTMFLTMTGSAATMALDWDSISLL